MTRPGCGLIIPAMTDLRTLYPELEPYATGMLDVGDGHSVYYERCGTPGATPAVFLHGGPVAAFRQAIVGCSIRHAMTCCCSTSGVAGNRRRMPV